MRETQSKEKKPALVSPIQVNEVQTRKSPAMSRNMDTKDRLLATSKLHQSHYNFEQKVSTLVTQMNQKPATSHQLYNLKPVRATSTSLSQAVELQRKEATPVAS